MSTLVVGGAGYIGSHVVRALVDRGEAVVVLDDLSSGHREAVHVGARFVHADMGDSVQIASVCREHEIHDAIHLAGRIGVAESVDDPRRHWRTNVMGATMLLDGLLAGGVSRVVLSSTAAVYGAQDAAPVREDAPERPVNPHGATMLAVERMVADYARAYHLSFTALRHFNVAGADHANGLGERHDPETHLIPNVVRAALGLRGPVEIFGDDHPTPDGTCVRDYVHVEDLADAHVLALATVRRGGCPAVINLGSNAGSSVNDVIAAVERLSKRKVARANAPRRPGDPPIVVAANTRAREALGWAPSRSSLDRILEDALVWHAREAT